MMTRILILYNEPTLPADHRDACSEHEIVFTVDEVSKVLEANDYEVHRLGAHVDPGRMIDDIKHVRPDVVFNLFEGLPVMGQTEAYAAGILDWLGLPYTGCPFQALVLARNKPLTKRLLRGAKLPTPNFLLIHKLPVKPCRLGWPVIVKPSNQDASVGVEQSSVVTNQEAYAARVEYVLAEYGGPVLVEEFIPGREFNVGLVETPELRTLPPWEVKFTDAGSEFWPIITYDAKWKPGTRDYESTPSDYQPQISSSVRRKMERLSKQAFRLLGCRDLARIDFRVTAEGKPYILEVNPNPDFSPIAGLSEGLEAAGLTHAELTLRLVQNALNRGAPKLTAPVGVQVIPW